MVNNLQKIRVFFFLIIINIFLFGIAASPVKAISYDLVAPTGPLQRGQEVQFTISIDTEGQTITSAQVGMAYQSGPLQYVSVSPGDTFDQVTVEEGEAGAYGFPSSGSQDAKRLIFTATKDGGFSGTGTFATVTFKIIATASGTAELCVLFNPENTPTPAPVQPTALPKTGNVDQTGKGILFGLILLAFASSSLLFSSLHKR